MSKAQQKKETFYTSIKDAISASATHCATLPEIYSYIRLYTPEMTSSPSWNSIRQKLSSDERFYRIVLSSGKGVWAIRTHKQSSVKTSIAFILNETIPVRSSFGKPIQHSYPNTASGYNQQFDQGKVFVSSYDQQLGGGRHSDSDSLSEYPSLLPSSADSMQGGGRYGMNGTPPCFPVVFQHPPSL